MPTPAFGKPFYLAALKKLEQNDEISVDLLRNALYYAATSAEDATQLLHHAEVDPNILRDAVVAAFRVDNLQFLEACQRQPLNLNRDAEEVLGYAVESSQPSRAFELLAVWHVNLTSDDGHVFRRLVENENFDAMAAMLQVTTNSSATRRILQAAVRVALTQRRSKSLQYLCQFDLDFQDFSDTERTLLQELLSGVSEHLNF